MEDPIIKELIFDGSCSWIFVATFELKIADYQGANDDINKCSCGFWVVYKNGLPLLSYGYSVHL